MACIGGIFRIWFCAVLLMLVSRASAEVDFTPPLLLGLEVSTSEVDVSSGPKTVRIIAHLRDDLSGVLTSQTYLSLRSNSVPLSGASPPLPPQLDFFKTTDIVVPTNIPDGNWGIAVSAFDVLGNFREWNASTLAGMGLPASVTIRGGTGGINPDASRMSVVDFKLSTNFINTIDGNRTLEADISVKFRCDFAVPELLQVSLRSSNLIHFASGYGLRRESIPVEDGVIVKYRPQITLPDYGEPGVWTAYFSPVTPPPGAVPQSPENLAVRFGQDALVTVVTRSKTNLPVVLDFEIATNRVDTTGAEQRAQVTIRFSSDLSSLTPPMPGQPASPSSARLIFTSPRLRHIASWSVTNFSDTDGNTNTIRLAGYVTFPRNCEDGVWSVRELSFRDYANNYVTLDANRLSAMGFPATITVVSKPNLNLTARPAPLISWRRPATPWFLEELDPAGSAEWLRTDDIQTVGDLNVLVPSVNSTSRLFRLVGH